RSPSAFVPITFVPQASPYFEPNRTVLFFYAYSKHRDLHSFPTRRSSDLTRVKIEQFGKVHERGRIQTIYVRQSVALPELQGVFPDRKSTRLNSSHVAISYAVSCL